jgi:predicted nucleotidyltransferase component of viral defense system
LIPRAFIQAWSEKAPWPDLRQIEQDLIISKALCDLFSAPALQGKIAFRGGTAINKLLFAKPLRYSEDIDLVQLEAEPIKSTVDAMRTALGWLGKPTFAHGKHSVHLVYSFTPEADETSTFKLKVEMNTREHKSLHDVVQMPFAMDNPWHTADVEIATYTPDELFSTKLRALLQREKNRDLFDLHHGLDQLQLDPALVVSGCEYYLAGQGLTISRATAEERMLKKLTRNLIEDIRPLLPPGVSYDEDTALRAFERVWRDLIARMKGEPWKLTEQALGELRAEKYPSLLTAQK